MGCRFKTSCWLSLGLVGFEKILHQEVVIDLGASFFTWDRGLVAVPLMGRIIPVGLNIRLFDPSTDIRGYYGSKTSGLLRDLSG